MFVAGATDTLGAADNDGWLDGWALGSTLGAADIDSADKMISIALIFDGV